MFQVRRSEDKGLVTFSLSGRIEEEQVAELQKLLEVEAGDARITLDDKAAAAGQTNVIAVSQGQTIGIDNSGDARSFVARLIRLSVPAQ